MTAEPEEKYSDSSHEPPAWIKLLIAWIFIIILLAGFGYAVKYAVDHAPVLKDDARIQVCEIDRQLIVVIDEDDLNTKRYSEDLDDCK